MHYQLRALEPEAVSPALAEMTFPRFRRFLSPCLAPEAVGVILERGSADPGLPLGMALGHAGSAGSGATGSEGELLSIFIRPRHRGLGYGARLLGGLEAALRARGCPGMSTVYMTRIPGLAAFEALLQSRGWSTPLRRMRVFRTDTDRLRNAAWMPLFHSLPDGIQIVRWDSLEARVRDALRSRLSRPDFPPDVSPFFYEGLGIDGSPAEPELSFACRRGDCVLGWHLAHRMASNQVRFSCSYVLPEAQAQVPLLALWNQAFRVLVQGKTSEVSWAIAPHHDAMERFTERLLGPYVTHMDETRGARKPLDCDC